MPDIFLFFCSFRWFRRGRIGKVPIFQQNFSQGQPGPGDAGFYGPQIQGQGVTDLLIAQSGQLPQHQNLPLLLRQGLQSPGQSPPLLGALQLPVGILAAEGKRITAESLSLVLGDPVVLARSQTYAFTVLGLSQLFHAVGMRDVGRSVFRMNHLENRLMLAAAALGVLLQVLVTENSRLVALFQTAALSGTEWRELLFLAAAPLAAHELLAGLSRISGARGTAEKERSGS